MTLTKLVTLAIVAACAFVAPSTSQAQLYGTSPFQNGGFNMGSLYRFDPDTGAYVDLTGVQVVIDPPAGAITGINSVSIDPTTGIAYAVVKVTAISGRVLVTLNLQTGVASVIGNLGDNFSSITFLSDGQLLGVTGDGATVPETVYRIDKTDATKVVLRTLGNGADGEVIAYNPADNNVYHWSGNGTVVFERFDTGGVTVTNIPITGTTNGETFGAVWDGCRDLFIGSNIGSAFNLWEANGTVGPQFGASPDDVRGMALIGGNTCNVDLALLLSANPVVPSPNDPIVLTVDVMNTEGNRAFAPTVAITLPANITSPTTTGCAEDPAGVPTCTLPKLFQGDVATFTIAGTFTGGPSTIQATVTTTSDEVAPADNSYALTLGDALFANGFE